MKPPSSFNPWPVSLIAFFTLLITAIASFVTFASSHKMDLVSPDYYDREVRFQQQIDLVQRTRHLTGSCQTTYASTNRTIQVLFPAEHRGHVTSGTISLYRPSNASLDQTFPIKPSENGLQSVPATALASGLWRVKVQWKVNDSEFYHEDSCVVP